MRIQRWLLLAACLFLATKSWAVDYYVSPQGSDAWSGKLASPNAAKSDGPFATLSKARDAVRTELKANGPGKGITVQVRGGLYEFKDTLKLTQQDSGTETARVIYQAYKQEKPTLIGGAAITGFTPYQGNILKADVAAQGFKGVPFHQLIFDGKRQHLARYPNYDANNPYGGGWAYADGKYEPMYKEIPGETKHEFQYKVEDTRTWAHPEEVEVFVFPRYNWWNNIVPIKSIDRTTRHVTLAKDASYPIRPTDRYYFENALEELDAPGEWYLDRRTWILYFWPPKPIDSGTVVAPKMRTILDLDKTANVTFEGFTFECAEGTGIVLRNSTNCIIARSTIRNIGDYSGSGVSVSGYKNGVVGNDIYEIGSSGIALNSGDRKKLTSAENYADNNYIHHIGVYYKQGVGIVMTGVGNRASHNLIHDGPRMGIMFSGNNLIMEYNEIRHVNLETSDTGAVYTGGRDWISSRGSVIRYNYFHDILGYGYENGKWLSPHFAWGVYLDDNTGGVDVIGNIIARTPRAGIHLHNGRDNFIDNNVFVEAGMQQVEYNGWTVNHSYWKNHLPTMIKGYESVINEPAWQNMRNIHLHPTNAVLSSGLIMAGNMFVRNIIEYKNPDSKLYHFSNVPFDHNAWDYNLVWHFGLPLRTGQKALGKEVGPNLAPNPGFEEGTPGKLPTAWNWQVHPPGAKAEWVTSEKADGKACLRLDSAPPVKEASGRPLHLNFVSQDIKAVPGKTYQLRAKFKALKAGTKVGFMLQSYVANVFFWSGGTGDIKAGTEWKQFSGTFKIPAPGEKGYNAQMKAFKIRIDVQQDDGTVFVDDVSLAESAPGDEWKAWQELGQDKNSLVADPLFVNPDQDDYHLKPNSPAFKLGFKPIPIDQIGPYKSPLRASWPIVEAEGAREKPLVSH